MFLCFCPGCLSSIFSLKKSNHDSQMQTIMEMYSHYRKDFPSIKEITVTELLEMQSNLPVTLVDIRGENERAVSMIPGAISESEFEAVKNNLINQPIVIYCTIGYRSGLYTKKITAQGYDVRNLIGGILAWTNSKQKLIHNGNSTKNVHVYGSKWNILPEGYTGMW